MKLLFAIVQNEDAKKLIRSLNAAGLMVTRISTTGGFLQGGNTTVMMGLDEERIDDALEIIKKEAKTRKEHTVAPQAAIPGYSYTYTGSTPLQITVGGAVVFIVDVWRYEQF